MRISDSSQSNNLQNTSSTSTSKTDSANKSTGSLRGLTVSQAQSPTEQPVGRLTGRNSLPSVNSVARTAIDGIRAASVGAPTISRLAATPLPNGQNDKAYDGAIIGANGTAYPANTPLNQVPPALPSDGRRPTETIIYVNGIRTDKEGQAGSLQALADRTGAAVVGVHNSTESTFKDLLQSLGDKTDIGRNPAVDSVANQVYDQLKAGQTVHLIGHSQGGLILSRALTDVRQRLIAEDGLTPRQAEARLSNVKVETFAAAAGSFPNGPQYVHYVNRADPVPGLFGLGSFGPIFGGEPNAGRGAVVHRFTDFSGVHDLETTYLDRRVPFDQARRNDF